MPILKQQTLYNSHEAQFHSILIYDIDMATGGCSCVLGSWRSREDFAYGVPPLIKRTFHFAATSPDVLQCAYEAIVGSPGFEGAEIVQ